MSVHTAQTRDALDRDDRRQPGARRTADLSGWARVLADALKEARR